MVGQILEHLRAMGLQAKALLVDPVVGELALRQYAFGEPRPDGLLGVVDGTLLFAELSLQTGQAHAYALDAEGYELRVEFGYFGGRPEMLTVSRASPTSEAVGRKLGEARDHVAWTGHREWSAHENAQRDWFGVTGHRLECLGCGFRVLLSVEEIEAAGRSDLLGYRGLCRELAAIGREPSRERVTDWTRLGLDDD